MKWVGDEVNSVGESLVLTVGRAVPGHGQWKKRVEGVAIVLMRSAVSAWKAGGCHWKAWSLRLITVTLVTERNSADYLHILSCYVPTFAVSRDGKDELFDFLQQALSIIPSGKKFVMLGDFNASEGSRGDDDEWWYARGPHDYGELNEADKELLIFLSTK